MKLDHRWWIGGALLLLPVFAGAQEKTPILSQSFEENEGGWTGLGNIAKTSITHDPANIKAGKGALQFDYSIAKGDLNALILPIQNGALAKAKAIRFWIKSDHAGPMVVALAEKDGGRYLAMFHVPQSGWQQVELAPSDFVLSQGKDDPKDPDGKLDLDQVENIGLLDLGQMLAQAGDPNLETLFNIKTGAHTLYLDDFSVSENPLPATPPAAAGDIRLDAFAHPQLAWLGVGDMRLSRSSGKPLEGMGMQAKFRETPGKFVGWVHPITPGILTGAMKLMFTVAVAKPMKMLVQVETLDGNKFNTILAVPGESAPQPFSLNFADFKAADDSKDPAAALNLSHVKQVVFADLSGAAENSDQDNTLWLNNLRASR